MGGRIAKGFFHKYKHIQHALNCDTLKESESCISPRSFAGWYQGQSSTPRLGWDASPTSAAEDGQNACATTSHSGDTLWHGAGSRSGDIDKSLAEDLSSDDRVHMDLRSALLHAFASRIVQIVFLCVTMLVLSASFVITMRLLQVPGGIMALGTMADHVPCRSVDVALKTKLSVDDQRPDLDASCLGLGSEIAAA